MAISFIMPYVTSYGLGLATLPLSVAVSEISTRIGQVCKLTSFSYTQRIRIPRILQEREALFLQERASVSTINGHSFFKKQIKLFLSNQIVPLVEELLFRKIMHEFIIIPVQTLFTENVNSLHSVAIRVVVASVIFGLAHWKETEHAVKFSIMNDIDKESPNIKTQKKKILVEKSMCQRKGSIVDTRNFLVITIISRSLLWSGLYEYSNHYIALTYGAHVSINYFWDFITL